MTKFCNAYGEIYVAVVASLPDIAHNAEEAIALLQAIQATASWAYDPSGSRNP